MNLFKKKKEEDIKEEAEPKQTLEQKLEELEQQYPADKGFWIYCKDIEKYNEKPPKLPLSFQTYALPNGNGVGAEIFLREYRVKEEYIYLDSSGLYFKIYDLYCIGRISRYDCGTLDRKEFETIEEAQFWIDNWCENAKIHQLWRLQQERRGELSC